MGESAKTNLLIDSLSEDSDDVPDLQLIPPNKTKKRKFRKVTVPKWPNRTKLEEERPDSSGPSYDVRRPNRCWVCCFNIVVIALLVGLVICSLFCMRLYKEIETLKNNFNASSVEYREKINRLNEKLTFFEEQLPTATIPKVSSGGAASVSSVDLNSTTQNDDVEKQLTSLLTEVTYLKSVVKNLTRAETATTPSIDNASHKLLFNEKFDFEYAQNFTLLLDNCSKLCSHVPSSSGPSSQFTLDTTQSSNNNVSTIDKKDPKK